MKKARFPKIFRNQPFENLHVPSRAFWAKARTYSEPSLGSEATLEEVTLRVAKDFSISLDLIFYFNFSEMILSDRRPTFKSNLLPPRIWKLFMVLLKLIKAIEETMQLSWFWKRLREMKLSTYFRLDRNKV